MKSGLADIASLFLDSELEHQINLTAWMSAKNK